MTTVFPDAVLINLDGESQIAGRILDGNSFGGGGVGDFVVIDCDSLAVFARVMEVRLPTVERLDLEPNLGRTATPHPIAKLHLLGVLDLNKDKIIGGVTRHPTLGAQVYGASPSIVGRFAGAISQSLGQDYVACVHLGHVKDSAATQVSLSAKGLFSRHCAILGTTGGGKSTTIATLLHSCCKQLPKCKIILIDPTGEYARAATGHKSCFLGTGEAPNGEDKVRIPPDNLRESDYFSILAPSTTQRIKLTEAIHSLRLVKILNGSEYTAYKNKLTSFFTQGGLVKKKNKPCREYFSVVSQAEIRKRIEDPEYSFEFTNLADQILLECVKENPRDEGTTWIEDQQSQGWCQPLVAKIRAVKASNAWAPIFGSAEGNSLFTELENFLAREDKQILRINLSQLSFDFGLREITVNLIGRWLNEHIRDFRLKERAPVVVVLDEAHNFLNQHLGEDEARYRLDAFEKLAKEGRKYWLSLVLATQQPRDIPAGILSQMGTLIVHRLINEADRRMVEMACGQIDAAAAKFVPNLAPGEAAIIGVDFPIPLTIQVDLPPPERAPSSTSPDFNRWK
ncbi:MAG: DUF87 domain-containing protein [Verrucomicrobiota bacterium JB022]|nr:DUF87 domain-containing protein [Verrucomicrobiota bacterium JB022]